MNDEFLKKHLELENEVNNYNILTELGNQAVSLKLIAGHGYHGGQYEILHQGKALLMSPEEAKTYLENLIKNLSS